MFALLAPALLAAAQAPASLPAASREDAAMTAAVDADQPRSVALLEELVNRNSGTLNLAGVEAVGRIMRRELEALGFTVRWVPMAKAGRAGHLVAARRGRAGTKRLLLIGHLDTVFEPSSPFQRFERRGDAAAGPGAGDNKGGMVVMLSALKAMAAAGTLKQANIEVVLTGDEESAGAPVTDARADLVAAGRRADAALDFEGLAREEGRDMGSIARRSANDWTLTVTARSGHSSGIFAPGVGDGAAFELARIVSRFRAELPEPNLTFNVGLVAAGAQASLEDGGAGGRAGGKTNIIAAQGVARGDFRTLSAEQTARVRAKMERIVAEHGPGAASQIAFKDGYPAMAPTAGNQALLAALNGVNRDLGLAGMPALDPLKRGAGDIAFVAEDVDGLVGLGAASSGDHTPAEQVDLPSMARQAKRAALLMTRLSRQKRGTPHAPPVPGQAGR